jgi:hypothetical protein
MDEEQLKSAFSKLNPEEAAIMVSALLEKQRQDLLPLMACNRKRTISYYNATAAAQVKQFVDEMIRTKQDAMFVYEDYPQHSHNTIRQKVDGGLMYLVDYDKTGLYVNWRKQVKVRRLPNAYCISWIRDPAELGHIVLDGSLKARMVKPESEFTPPERKNFMGDLAEFLASSKPGDWLNIKDIKLTNNDITAVHNLFEPVKELFELRITPTKITVHNGKINEDNTGD